MALVALFAFVACGDQSSDSGGGGGGESQKLSLDAYDYYFEPTTLPVNLNAIVSVTFTNNGGVSHSFTAPDLDVEQVVDSGNSSTVTFTAPAEPGSFDFFCKFHPDQMKGTITVGGADQPLEQNNQPAPTETSGATDDDSGYGY